MCKRLITRRQLVTGMSALSLAAMLPRWGQALERGPSKITMDQAMTWLREGNRRFANRSLRQPNLTVRRQRELADTGQHPFATIISCSDSRVPVEMVFDRGLGDLFVVRVAGNVADTDEIATCEYGIGHLATPLLVVLGHSQCGAVTAVVKQTPLPGKLPLLVDNIQPAVDRARTLITRPDEDALILAAVKENVRQSLADIFRGSEEITRLTQQGRMAAVGGVYHVETGEVEWL
ncbi:MAG: carbonic anhydrase [Magnetococcales bacterium]|nr:carbonic anhydrase [Magnetococcales bacterium]